MRTVPERAFGRNPPRGPSRPAETHNLLRAEVFSGEQLWRHARALAGLHRIDQRRAPNRLLARLAENEQILVQTHDLLIAAEAEGWRMTPAGEWLLDNFYLIEQQVRMARRHLPRTYNRQLPRLTTGPSSGFPRVYDIALELIAHSDGRLDAQSLALFVTSYQSTSPLTLGELWAVPIMLRLALIENMRRVAEDIAQRRREREAARQWADRLLEAAEKGPTEVLQDLAAMARADPPFTNPFREGTDVR